MLSPGYQGNRPAILRSVPPMCRMCTAASHFRRLHLTGFISSVMMTTPLQLLICGFHLYIIPYINYYNDTISTL